jgi:RNA polymerase sigma-70 factor (ECF subfamily)
MAEDQTTTAVQRYLDELAGDSPAVELQEGQVPAPPSSGSGLSPDGRRILAAIEGLPQGEREASDRVRIQGMSQAGAAQALEVSVMTVHRRLNRGLQLLAATPGDLYPGRDDSAVP